MLQDLEAGKPLELDCMTGAVIELAARLDIAVPHTAAVHACAKLLDRRIAFRLDGRRYFGRQASSRPNVTSRPSHGSGSGSARRSRTGALACGGGGVIVPLIR